MLDGKKIPYRYRDYRKEPLSEAELVKLVKMLGVPAGELLRRNDPLFKELGLSGKEPDAVLVRHMARHPTLLTRPIAVAGARAIVGRPPERILEIA